MPKLAWLTCCVAVLIMTLIRHDERDIGIVFVYLMVALTFPIGVGVVSAIAWIAMQMATNLSLPPNPGAQFIVGIAIWVAITWLGYFQWFVLLPWLWRKLMRRKTRKPNA